MAVNRIRIVGTIETNYLPLQGTFPDTSVEGRIYLIRKVEDLLEDIRVGTSELEEGI